MSVFRGIATGFLGGAIEDKAAKDKNKAEVLKGAAQNYYTNTLPQTIEMENNRKSNFEILSSTYTPEFANVADASGFTVDKASMDRLETLLKTNKIDKKKLESANFATDYNTRYETRGKTFEEKYAPIFEQLGVKQIGSIGPYTVKSQLEGDAQMDEPKAPTTPMEENRAFSSMQVSDFLMPIGTSVALDANKFAKAAESVRGFDELITIDPVSKEASVKLGNRSNEYTALRNITQEVLPQFGTGKEGEASLPAAISFANKVLDQRVNQVIFGKQTETGRIPGLVELKPDPKNPNNMVASNSFSGGFLNKFSTAPEQKTYLAQGIRDLPTLEEQRYFAETFPEGVKFNDGSDAKIFLLQITGLAK
jgi:hypothetical protein